MADDIKKFLQDIMTCIVSIDVHLQNKRDYNLYSSNITIQRAVERELEIIGEVQLQKLKKI